MDLEVDTEHGDPDCQPAEVIVAGAVIAACFIDRGDLPEVERRPADDLLGRGVEGEPRLVAVRRRRDPFLDVGRRVLGWQPARRESNAGRGWFRQSIDSERAPVVPAPVPSDEVPATAEVDEAGGLDEAAA